MRRWPTISPLLLWRPRNSRVVLEMGTVNTHASHFCLTPWHCARTHTRLTHFRGRETRARSPSKVNEGLGGKERERERERLASVFGSTLSSPWRRTGPSSSCLRPWSSPFIQVTPRKDKVAASGNTIPKRGFFFFFFFRQRKSLFSRPCRAFQWPGIQELNISRVIFVLKEFSSLSFLNKNRKVDPRKKLSFVYANFFQINRSIIYICCNLFSFIIGRGIMAKIRKVWFAENIILNEKSLLSITIINISTRKCIYIYIYYFQLLYHRETIAMDLLITGIIITRIQ